MKVSKLRHTSAALALAIGLVAGSARAQDAAQSPQQQPPEGTGSPAAPQGDTGTAPGEIVVTANKRSESVLKVPATIAVLGGNDLKTVGVNNVNDIQNVVPSVNIGTGAFGTNVSIRGVTSTDETSKGELGIAFNIDGAFVGRGQEQGIAFFDLERVEVLKGPQGTLYGRSSTGGAINVITKKPVLGETSGYAKAELGNYNTRRLEGAINLPLGDMFALRFAGSYNHRDGYLDPTDITVSGSPTANNGAGPTTIDLKGDGLPKKNDQKDQTGRASLLFQPSDNVHATVVATVGHLGGAGNGTALENNLEGDGTGRLDIIPNYVPSFVRENFTNFNEQLNWKFGGNVQFDLLGNEQHFKDHSQNTGNGNPFDTGNPTAPPSFGLDDYHGIFDTNQVEARLSNVDTGFIDYVVGANYYHEKIQESDHNWTAPITPDGTLSDTTQWNSSIDPVNTTKHESYGFFGQFTLHFTDKFSAVAGARYTHDESNRVGTFAVGNVPGCTYPNDCIGGPNNGTERDHKVTWRVGLNYQATPRDLFYASVATGFKAGGFNDFDPSTNSVAPYGPEQLTAYEIGYKGRPTSKLTVSLSGYYYDYAKDQINGLTLFPTPAGVVGVLFTQLAPVKMYGSEAELHYQLDHATTLNVSVAYEHSKIKELMAGSLGYLTGTFADFSGQALPNTPKFVSTVSATHNFDLGGGSELRLRGATKFSSGYNLTDFANAVQYRQKAYARSDASLTYAAPQDKWTVQLFVENIQNKVQRTAGPIGYNGTYGGFTGLVPSPEVPNSPYPINSLGYGVSTPRFFGVRVGVKF